MKKLAVLLVIISGALWGTSAIFTTELKKFGFDALNIAFMRNTVAAICMIVFALIYKRDNLKISAKQILLYILVGVTLYGNGALYYAAMGHISISIAVVLLYIAPAVVTIYSVIAFKEKFTLGKCLAVVMVIVGTALVAGIVGDIKLSAFGLFLGFMSGISYSVYNIGIKYEMKRGDDPVVATAYAFVISALVSAIIGRPAQTMQVIMNNFQPSVLLWCVLLGIVTAALPYFIYTYAMKKLPAGVTTSLGCVEPMTASIISFTVYSEPISVYSIVGIVLILASVVLLSKD